jgi:hypothetical protein
MHRLAHFLFGLTLLLSVAAIGVAWRLSHGPVDLDFLKGRVESAVNTSVSPLHVSMGGLSIAWRGFSHGLDQPLVLRVTDLTIDEPNGGGRAHVPVAEAALSARWLLAGRILPRSITLEQPTLILSRDTNGSVSFAVGANEQADAGETVADSTLGDLLAVLGAPVQTDLHGGGRRLSQLSSISIQDARFRFDDRVLRVTWLARHADLDFARHAGGGVDGQATLTAVLAGQQATLQARFSSPPSGRQAHVAIALSPVTPKALASAAPVLTPLAALDAPVTLEGVADLKADLTPAHMRVTARAGAGVINVQGTAIPMRRGEATVEGTLDQATLRDTVFELQAAPGGQISTLRIGGQLTREPDDLDAALHLSLDLVAFADLAEFWPRGAGGGARAWVTQNVRAGTAHDGQADFELKIPADAADTTLVKAAATLDGDNVSVTWMPAVPPIEQAKAHLVMTDPDKIEINVSSGRQKVAGADPLVIQSGQVSISGLTGTAQLASIRCDITGSIPSAIALLKDPGLHLLDHHPLDPRSPAGDARMHFQAAVPLRDDVSIDDVTIHAAGTLSSVHLSGLIANKDLDAGSFALDADTTRLTIKGSANLASIRATIDGLIDFRDGPPTQVTQKYNVSGTASARALAAAGLDATEVVTGDVGMNLVLSEYRNGDGDVAAAADFSRAELWVAPLGWRAPAGAAVKGSARVLLSKDRLTGIDRVAIDGPEIEVRGSVTVSNGSPDAVTLDHVILGRTDVKGAIRLPRGGPIGIDLTGSTLDVSAKLTEPAKPLPATPIPPGPAWSMHGRFDHVVLAHGQIATNVEVTADDDGEIMRGLSIAGSPQVGAAGGRPFAVRIGRAAGNGATPRHLTVIAADAGALLHGLDVTSMIEGGTLNIAGDFNDTTRAHLLSGTLDISDFRVLHAPAFGKLLQAVTLYGLVDALGGPGVSFTRFTAPFRYDGDTLTVHDARAFSSSLGLTVEGRVDRAEDRLDLKGTLVPAYVFNSLLGNVPFIGRLFSAEKGGGLFAVNYSLSGPTDNPTVSANPLSALTPGILRDMFGLFNGPGPGQTAPAK